MKHIIKSSTRKNYIHNLPENSIATWWALGDRYRRSYWANETQNIKVSSGAYDGDLLGCDGEVKFGIFRLNANEVVPELWAMAL